MTTNQIETFGQIDQTDTRADVAHCRLCQHAGAADVLVQNSGKRLLRCGRCHVAFLDPQPTLDTLTEDFVDHHLTSEDRLHQLFSSRRESTLVAVAKHMSRGVREQTRILDVGCAGGHFLERFLLGRHWQRFGAEPSRFASDIAARKGIEMYQGMFASLNLPVEYFDVISMLDVLYYFPEPERELRLARKALKPTGALWVQVPLGETEIWRNSSPIVRALGMSSRSLFASMHLYYFNLHSLSYILKKSGFEIAEVFPLPPNRQPNFYNNLLYQCYYALSQLFWAVSLHQVNLGPSVLIKATPTIKT